MYVDKIAHIGMYMVLSFALCRALTHKSRHDVSFFVYRKAIFLSIFACFLYGLSDEWHQSFTPGRSVEAADVMADILGATLGAFLTIPYRKWVLKIQPIR